MSPTEKFLSKNFLWFVVFVTGAAVLVVEITALRILSPYYGNTIFAVSSVISTILAALGCGYYIGGRLADKHPFAEWFFGIIMFSGLSLLGFHLGGILLLPILSDNLSMTSGPLISTILIFLFPAFLMGMLSPYAIKLQAMLCPKTGVGSVSGAVFFWSTLGSIAGSLLAGFALIPHFGVNNIMIVTAIMLFTLGLLPLLKLGITKRLWQISLLAMALLVAGSFFFAEWNDAGAIYKADGVYERLVIHDGTFKGRKKRILMQDRSASGAIYLDSDDPTELPVPYVNFYRLYKIFTPNITDALVIGGGVYSVPRALLAERPDLQIHVAEIEPELYTLAQKYFGLPQSAHLHNHVEDGRRLLTRSNQKYDLIFSDVYYSLFSVPPHFMTREFFELAKSRLRPEGVFIASIVGDLSRQAPSLVMSGFRTFRTVFPNSYFFAVDSPKRIDSQNIVFVGYNSTRHIDMTSPGIIHHDDKLIRTLKDKLIDLKRYELSTYPLLTDDYAPVEYLTGRMFQRSVDGPLMASCTSEMAPLDGKEILSLIDQQARYRTPVQIQDFLHAEMKALSPNDTEIKNGNIIVHIRPRRHHRIMIATEYGVNKDPSAPAVVAELARMLANTLKSPAAGVDLVFLDAEKKSNRFTNLLNDLYGTTKPTAGLVIGHVCGNDLTINPAVSRDPTSDKSNKRLARHFLEIATPINTKLFHSPSAQYRHDQSQGQKNTRALSDAMSSAGIPSLYLSAISKAPDKSGHTADISACNPKKLEHIAGALFEYLYKAN